MSEKNIDSKSRHRSKTIEMLQALTQVFIDMGEEELKSKDNGVVQMDAAVFRMRRG